jgi:hypothetical protein
MAIYICGMRSDIQMRMAMEATYDSKTANPKAAALEYVHGTGEPALETMKSRLKELKATIRRTIAGHTLGQVAAMDSRKERGEKEQEQVTSGDQCRRCQRGRD